MEEDHIVADLRVSLQHELATLCDNVNEAENFTIFRTPHNISQSTKNLFKPSIISIGPLHRGQKHLQALEEQKRQFLRDYLSRGDHISLDLSISEMKFLEDRTRRCYSETVDLDSNEFVRMMLLDGCFLLEYFIKLIGPNLGSIVEVGWNYSSIDRDLLLLENQIPFFIVEKLYEIIGLNYPIMNFVNHIAVTFLARALTKDFIYPIIQYPPAEIHHLVHLCYNYLVPNPEKPVVLISKSFDLTRIFSTNKIIEIFLHLLPSKMVSRGGSAHSTSRSSSVALLNSIKNISSIVIPSTTELKHKGLKFKPKINPKHMLDISFEYGVLKIPKLAITNENKLLIANLVAFEYSKYGKEESPFTTFLEFWGNLVKKQNDVKILQKCGIIENWLGSEKEVTDLINQVTEGNIIGENHYLAELYTEVNRYIEINWDRSSWNKLRAELNKRKAISVTAFIALVLTLVQSFYTVYAYYYPPRS